MKTFKIEEDDIVFGTDRELKLVEGIDEVSETLERRVTTRVNEFFLDRGVGMDYSELEKKSYDKEIIKDNIREVIFQDERIDSVEDINIEINGNTRQIQVNFVIIVLGTTLSGEVNI